MSVNGFNPDSVWQPFGAFSMAVVQGAGRIVHLKGQVSLDAQGEIVAPLDMERQTDKALENIRSVLSAFGGRMEDIYALVHHVTDMDKFMKTGHIRTRYFSPPYPVTTTVEVSRLYDPALMVEITASAEVPLDRFMVPEESRD